MIYAPVPSVVLSHERLETTRTAIMNCLSENVLARSVFFVFFFFLYVDQVFLLIIQELECIFWIHFGYWRDGMLTWID